MYVLLTLLVFHYLGFFATKSKSNQLYCGLFGWVGADPKEFNKSKFDILGIFNIERGKHSCGVAVDGDITKGYRESHNNNTANFMDFLVEDSFDAPTDVPVVIGHTRHATVGQHTYENAHPFKFELDEGYVIGAHNGTLRNKYELARKYQIEDQHLKIDSQILLEILSTGKVEVLSDYEGAAALLVYSSEDKNSLWVFRGESRTSYGSDRIEEERPLFFYQESETSMYISSLADSLRAICNTKEDKEKKVFRFNTNTLYKITNGQIEKRFKIDRSEVYKATKAVNYTKPETKENNTSSTGTNSKVKRQLEITKNTITNVNPDKLNNILYEKVIHEDLVNQDIYFEHLRYKRTGHLVDSICVFIKEMGFVKLCSDAFELDKIMKNYKYYDTSISEYIEIGDLKEEQLFYIYKGILLKDKADYIALTKGVLKDNDNHVDHSQASVYPIIDFSKIIELKKKPATKYTKSDQTIILENQLFDGVIRPIGTFSEYIIENGVLVEKKELDEMIEPMESKTIDLYENIDNSLDEEDDDTDDENFCANLIQELIDIADSQLVDNIISYGVLFDQMQSLAQAMEPFISDSEVVSNIIEYSIATEKSFSPIADKIEQIAEIAEEQEEENK